MWYQFFFSNCFSNNLRKKTRTELVRVSAAVMGIEFSYAAETAFVSPTLLKIGVDHQHMTLVWALSPLVGFFVTPILGSISDRCRLKYGRRRPFILLLALGVFIGEPRTSLYFLVLFHQKYFSLFLKLLAHLPFLSTNRHFKLYGVYLSINRNFCILQDSSWYRMANRLATCSVTCRIARTRRSRSDIAQRRSYPRK